MTMMMVKSHKIKVNVMMMSKKAQTSAKIEKEMEWDSFLNLETQMMMT